MCLFWQNKWVSGPVEFVWPYHLSCGLFVLATKSNVGKGAALLQLCSKYTKSHQATMGQHTGQVWVGKVSFAVSGRHDTTVKIVKLPHSLNTHVGFGEGS